MARSRIYQKPNFASTGKRSDTTANVYMSMLLSPAWIDLTKGQQVLYLYCMAQLYAEKRIPVDGQPDAVTFTMNKHKWHEVYKLYSEKNQKSFYNDRDALIAHGFIRVARSMAKEKTVYAFSDKWQQWPDITIHPNDMSSSLRHRHKDSA